jgi:hypothetical protein
MVSPRPPSPNRRDPDTFADRADARFDHDLNIADPELNAVGQAINAHVGYFNGLYSQTSQAKIDAQLASAQAQSSAQAAQAVGALTNYRGAFVAGTTYQEGRSVSHNGFIWIANVSTATTPSPSTSDWTPIIPTCSPMKRDPIFVADFVAQKYRTLVNGAAQDVTLTNIVSSYTKGGYKPYFDSNGFYREAGPNEYGFAHDPQELTPLGFAAGNNISNEIYPSEPYHDGTSETYAFGDTTHWAGEFLEIKGVRYDRLVSEPSPISFTPSTTSVPIAFGLHFFDDMTISTGSATLFRIQYKNAEGDVIGDIIAEYSFETKLYTITGNPSSTSSIRIMDRRITLGHHYLKYQFRPADFGITYSEGDTVEVSIGAIGLFYSAFFLHVSTGILDTQYIRTTTATRGTDKALLTLNLPTAGLWEYTFYAEFSRCGAEGGTNPIVFTLYSENSPSASYFRPWMVRGDGWGTVSVVNEMIGYGNVPLSRPKYPLEPIRIAVSFNRNGTAIAAVDGVSTRIQTNSAAARLGSLNRLALFRSAGAGDSDNYFYKNVKVWNYSASLNELVTLTSGD